MFKYQIISYFTALILIITLIQDSMQTKDGASVVKKVHKTCKNKLVEADIINILKLYHIEKLSHKDIALKFGVSRQHISKVLAANDARPTPAGVLVTYNPADVLGRVSMSNFDRAKRITDDAMQACEFSISLIRHELAALNTALDGGGTLKQQGIDTDKFIEKLTRFFAATAPYCIERKDGKIVEGDATPDSQLHKLMIKSIPLKKAQ
jgi:predicted DNA-binding protein (UPF0251 family)